MLINLSNHPSDKWSENQRHTAIDYYGDIIDLPFPVILPAESEEYVLNLSKRYFKKCQDLIGNSNSENNAVHIMGEYNFTLALVTLLLKSNIICISSTTERIVKELDNGNREVSFKFIRFREYKRV